MKNEKAIDEFKKLLAIADYLMGPEGCPWDREQTCASLRSTVLEETCEVIEAIDAGDDVNLVEELGDLFYNVLFFGKIGEKEGRFSMRDVIFTIREKLIARHPHVFKGEKAKTAAEALKRWEEAKKQEKSERKSHLDGIPKAMPALARGYKVAGKFDKASYDEASSGDTLPFSNEEELGFLLWKIAKRAKQLGINPEMALRKTLLKKERLFRDWEKNL